MGMRQAGASRTCANCGTVNAASDQFCANCGYALTGGPPQQTIISAIPPQTPSSTLPSVASVPSTRRVTGSLAAGNLLYGRYRIVQMVGKGGFGAVYQAHDEHFKVQRVVAVKEMSDAQLNPADKAQAIADFRQEAELLVPLQHVNLPDIKDFFEEGGKAYLVMEFIAGKTLEAKQNEAGGPLPEPLVMGWALQLCDVLQYLHTQPQPIIFRDLKPSNIMVTSDGRIKLIDFGIARIFKSTATKDTTSLGSRGYAPLEQYGRGQTDERSDIYALGATLYDLLTKKTPTDAVTRKVNPSLFEEPRQINPQISPASQAIVLKAMEEDPKDRFASAADMYSAIVANSAAARVPTGIGPYSAATLANPLMLQSQTATQLSAAPAAPTSPVSPVPSTPVPSATGSQTPGRRGVSRRGFIFGGAIALAAATGAVVLGDRLLSPPPASIRPTLTLKIGYSTEKDAWMQAAIAAFHNSSAAVLSGSNKVIQIDSDNSGSLDVGDKILSGEDQFAAWSPASDLELNRLNFKWNHAHGGKDIIGSSTNLAPQSLVSSPLVFAVWKDRADVLQGKYGSIDWPTLYTVLKLNNGWADLGHPEWGTSVHLGQTLPDASNSGLLAITLMAYAYAAQQGQFRLTIDQVRSSALWTYIQIFESAVNGFGRSSGTYFQGAIGEGPSAFDSIITYENLVLTSQNDALLRGHEALHMFYPRLNAVSNHPFAILDAQWVAPDQKQAAMQFRNFLLARKQQLKALQYGFRPSDPGISLKDTSVANNPFAQFEQVSPKRSIGQDISPQATTPSGEVVEALITQWEQHNPNPSIGTG